MPLNRIISQARSRLGSPASGNLLLGAGVALLTQGVGMGLKYLMDLLFARWMGAEAFGTYIYTVNWVIFLALPAGMGLSVSVVRFVPGYLERGEEHLLAGLVRRSRQLTMLSGLAVAALATLLFTFFVPEGMDAVVLRCGMWLIPLWALLALQVALVQGTRRIGLAYTPAEVLRPLFTILVGLAVLMATDALWPIAGLGAFAAALVTAVVVQALIIKRVLPGTTRERPPAFQTRLWMTVSLPLLLGNASIMVLQKADSILLGTILGPLEAGIYQGAAKTQFLANAFLIAVNAIAAPTIGRLHARGEHAQMSRMVRTAAKATFWPSLAVTVTILLAAGPVLSIWGAEFPEAANALRILVVGQLLNASMGPVGWLLSLTGHQRMVAWVYGTAALVNIVLNLVLIPTWGLEGAALATATTMIMWNIWMYRLVVRYLGIRCFAFARRSDDE